MQALGADPCAPWGTGQAVLAAKKLLNTPFIVINADDYYGKEGFRAVHEYLVNGGKSCMAGFVLKNTLSDNGGVTRGICTNGPRQWEGSHGWVEINGLVYDTYWAQRRGFRRFYATSYKKYYHEVYMRIRLS